MSEKKAQALERTRDHEEVSAIFSGTFDGAPGAGLSRIGHSKYRTYAVICQRGLFQVLIKECLGQWG